MNYGCVYKVTNMINNKIWIGKTVNFEKRKKLHIRDLRSKREGFFYDDFRKHGENNFKWEILQYYNTRKELSDGEIYYISLFESTNKNKGYNVALGGDGCIIPNRKLSEERKKAIGDFHRGKKRPQHVIDIIRKANTGKKRTEEQKQKLRDLYIGTTRTEEIKKKISDGQTGPKNHFYSKKHTDASKEKMRQAKLGKKATESHKKKISEALKGRIPWNKGKNKGVV